MDYTGEHLLPGQLGHFFITLSLVASAIATFAYFKSTKSFSKADATQWKKLGRYAFITEVVSVFAIFATLFYIIHSHYFEYKYAWQHTSLSLEVKYMLASFWEGQEGSFLLWTFWHCILGLILMKGSKEWEAPVMTIMSFVQFCLATMIAGIYIFGWKMGSNPFILLRDSGVLDNAPALHMNFDISQPLKPDYLASITDGNDLNPLLQNYWMVIHPPVLFLGFASTIVPFAFVIAGLWKKKFAEWTKPALPWALFSAAALGTGIMMGAAWAYESLTFGGYWAWDPVENASLVPWMVMIAGIHCLLIFKHSGHSLRITHLFFILAFSLVLYSTFLTRSGVLGDTSVHAFTDLGMNWQLIGLMIAFIIPSMFLYINRYKQIPAIQKEENATSREFWMFIGSLVFFLSALLIIGKTSVPAFVKMAPPEDPEFAYNRIQVFVAVIIALVTAIAQYLKYKETPGNFFRKKIWLPTVLSVIVSALILAFGNIDYNKYGYGFLGSIWLAVACSVYAIIANGAYIWLGLKGSLKLSGGSIAHLGFGMVLLSILISSSKKEILSFNTSGIAINFGEGSKEKSGENLTLVKDVRTDMGKYWVTYEGSQKHPKKPLWIYDVHFESKDGKEKFDLHPNAFINYKGNEGLMANPSSKHYWDHDVFTYITSLPDPTKNTDTSQFKNKQLQVGDTTYYSKGYFILEKVVSRDSIPTSQGIDPTGNASLAVIKVHSMNNSSYTAQPLLVNQRGRQYSIPDTVVSQNLIFAINSIQGDKVNMGIKEPNTILQYLTLKAYKFPYINLLWLGVIITVTGIIISMVRRIHLNRISASES
ncbi:MAG: cytochrome c biogenesis protein CcsA [Bacteroidetes bacterium]|nr:cytochrome c biogenesis protein CcsA [Bacteroidota bacterium]MBS1930382.1 cytochrome c biogenesis protein CcsA [Bacteroidota bacterium]